MSVHKSQRNESKAAYVYKAQQLLLYSIRILRKMPTSYRYLITNDLLKNINDYYDFCLKGNSIYISKYLGKKGFELRESYLAQAKASLQAFSGKLTILYELLKEGNNVFKNEEAMGRAFKKWGLMVNECNKLLRGVVESDKKRWKDLYSEKQKKNKKNNKSKEATSKEIQDNEVNDEISENEFDSIEHIADGLINNTIIKRQEELQKEFKSDDFDELDVNEFFDSKKDKKQKVNKEDIDEMEDAPF